ncbi:phosphatidylinositol-glycan biosynthesis class F protein isoform X3 [Arabidopsis lyrata subsp. lyrata]|uniref:phosphatidylinositol-glycan biosynthesis class F protein isoform X3 n=1 Tax=Arabidopsis lyrata subsp. lyrata TaxID=81972 RepID=UPI000A29AD79|nr:phosphatidylinositol-glycan biosynthesis class F protein isoform X3 [Arabidopsis lyrata subsp. lyrata]|eukprot:XP_020867565.1 phosphatidylinositol-glycan biosynthesis class F protein isoform X3 [Arabidopsis lyrata subsp. lyrata]
MKLTSIITLTLYFRAVGRSIVGLISGALINAFGAVSLGAPIGMQSLPRTIHWSFLMSVFTVVPATAVFGASWTDWHRVFASLKPTGNIEYMILIPAYGAIIGAWFGAWPMPLDWERPWQEWPVCVCYGAIGGCIVGQIVSLSLMILLRKHKNLKLA